MELQVIGPHTSENQKGVRKLLGEFTFLNPTKVTISLSFLQLWLDWKIYNLREFNYELLYNTSSTALLKPHFSRLSKPKKKKKKTIYWRARTRPNILEKIPSHSLPSPSEISIYHDRWLRPSHTWNLKGSLIGAWESLEHPRISDET